MHNSPRRVFDHGNAAQPSSVVSSATLCTPDMPHYPSEWQIILLSSHFCNEARSYSLRALQLPHNKTLHIGQKLRKVCTMFFVARKDSCSTHAENAQML